jgi:hypothetical protein
VVNRRDAELMHGLQQLDINFLKLESVFRWHSGGLVVILLEANWPVKVRRRLRMVSFEDSYHLFDQVDGATAAAQTS